MNAHRIENSARRFLDNWRIWMLIAFFGLGGCLVWLFALNSHQATENARRIAAERASSVSDVTNCFQGVRDGPQTTKLLGLLVTLADNSIRANEQALRTANSDPELNRIRRGSLARLRPARDVAGAFVKRVKQQTPTVTGCKALAAKLGVDPRPINKSINLKET